MCTNYVARQCAEGERATICTFCPTGLYQDAGGSTNCTLSAAGMYQDATGHTECKVCDVVNVTHLYEYLEVTENNATGVFALTGAAACCSCETGTYDSDANSSTVVAKQCAEGQEQTTARSVRQNCTKTPLEAPTARSVRRGCTRTPLDKPSARCAML